MRTGSHMSGLDLASTAHLTRALSLLAVGSLIVLVSWIMVAGSIGGDPLLVNFAMILAWLGALLHFGAWGHFAFGLPSRSLGRKAFGLSIVAFTVGMITLPYALPPLMGWSPWFFLLFTGFFVQVPSVYGPVVASHGIIFIRSGGHVQSSRRQWVAKLAALSLLVFGSFALIMQVLNPGSLNPLIAAPLMSLAGLTGFSYLAIRLAWGGGDPEEREERLRAVSW